MFILVDIANTGINLRRAANRTFCQRYVYGKYLVIFIIDFDSNVHQTLRPTMLRLGLA